MADKDNPARKVKTVPFRMSFPHLLTPKEDEDTGRKTFQLTMLYPPGTDLAPFKVALKAAMVDKFGEDTSKWPKLKRKPADVLVDFGEYNASRDKPLPGDWKGWTMVRANAPEAYPPGVVGPAKGSNGKFPSVTDAREIYGGRWARSTIDAFHYPKQGGGVTFGLKNVQLLKAAESFSGAITAPEDDFDNASDEWAGEADAFDSGKESAGAKATEKDSDWG